MARSVKANPSRWQLGRWWVHKSCTKTPTMDLGALLAAASVAQCEQHRSVEIEAGLYRADYSSSGRNTTMVGNQQDSTCTDHNNSYIIWFISTWTTWKINLLEKEPQTAVGLITCPHFPKLKNLPNPFLTCLLDCITFLSTPSQKKLKCFPQCAAPFSFFSKK